MLSILSALTNKVLKKIVCTVVIRYNTIGGVHKYESCNSRSCYNIRNGPILSSTTRYDMIGYTRDAVI